MYSFEEVASVTRKGRTFWSCGVSDANKNSVYTSAVTTSKRWAEGFPVGTPGLYTGFGRLSLKKTALVALVLSQNIQRWHTEPIRCLAREKM